SMVKEKLNKHPLITEQMAAKLKAGDEIDDINKYINEQHAEPIYNNDEVVGCVKRAHEVDINLNAHVIFENLVAKASGTLAFMHLVNKNNIDVTSSDYVIECSEEACGDMNPRG